MQAIDAVDNGQDLYTVSDFGAAPLDVSEVLGLFNPLGDDEDFDSQFQVAVALATTLLQRYRLRYETSIAAERTFLEAYAASPKKTYVVLEKFVPHGGIATKQSKLLFTVFPGATGHWTIQTVRPESSQFGSRKELPESWRGLGGAEARRGDRRARRGVLPQGRVHRRGRDPRGCSRDAPPGAGCLTSEERAARRGLLAPGGRIVRHALDAAPAGVRPPHGAAPQHDEAPHALRCVRGFVVLARQTAGGPDLRCGQAPSGTIRAPRAPGR